MTPTVIQRLRCTLRDLWHYDGCGCNTCVPVAEVIAAVEQELAAKDAEIAALTRSVTGQLAAYEHPLWKAHLERYSAGRIAALEAEVAELRKRPTLEAALKTVEAWEHANRHALSYWIDSETDEDSLEGRFRALYAEKARAEAQK